MMLFLKMGTAPLSSEQLEGMGEFVESLSEHGCHPVLARAQREQASLLGLPFEQLSPSTGGIQRSYDEPSRFAEVLGDGESLVIVEAIEADASDPTKAPGSELAVRLYSVSPKLDHSLFGDLSTRFSEYVDAPIEPHLYQNPRFDELKREGRTSPSPIESGDLEASRLLADRSIRTAATAIKSSGGLLVGDLPKQLGPDNSDRADEVVDDLQSHGLIANEVVVICQRSQAQVVRVPSREVLQNLAQQGLKCACGRDVLSERQEEALTITDQGRELLDKSRWLTILVLHELQQLGIDLNRTLIEVEEGGEEMDCFADISGELVLFELKDKEVSLGNAYSFGAKIGIFRPNHPVIVTSANVGSDVKEHFKKAGGSEPVRYGGGHVRYLYEGESRTGAPRYIEGMDNLASGLSSLVSEIYAADSSILLNRVLPLATLNSRSVVDAIARQSKRPRARTPEAIASNGSTAEG